LDAQCNFQLSQRKIPVVLYNWIRKGIQTRIAIFFLLWKLFWTLMSFSCSPYLITWSSRFVVSCVKIKGSISETEPWTKMYVQRIKLKLIACMRMALKKFQWTDFSKDNDHHGLLFAFQGSKICWFSDLNRKNTTELFQQDFSTIDFWVGCTFPWKQCDTTGYGSTPATLVSVFKVQIYSSQLFSHKSFWFVWWSQILIKAESFFRLLLK